MSKLHLDSLLSELLEIRFSARVSQDEIPALIEESIQARDVFVLLTEAMSSGDVKAVENVLNRAEGVLNDYGAAVKSANSKYLTNLLAGLKKRLEKQKSDLRKAKDSDDIRAHVKYKDAVSDTGILIVSALRSIRNGVNATTKLVQSMGADAFNPAGEESEESQDTLSDFSRLIGQALADNSLGKRMKPEVLQQFESELAKQVEKPSVGRGLGKFIAQIGSKNLRVDPEKLLGAMLALSADELQELDRSVKRVEGAVQQAEDTAEDTVDELQADVPDAPEQQEEPTTDEGAVETGQFYRYTTRAGKESIVRVEDVLDNGNVQLKAVGFEDNNIKTRGTLFAVASDRLGDRLTDDDVKEAFDEPEEQIRSAIETGETADEIVDVLEDVPAEELTDTLKANDPRPKIGRSKGVEAFKAVTRSEEEAGLLYQTVKTVLNKEVGYDLFESKQEVNNFDRWARLAGIKEEDK